MPKTTTPQDRGVRASCRLERAPRANESSAGSFRPGRKRVGSGVPYRRAMQSAGSGSYGVALRCGAQASIVRVRQAPSARKTASQTISTTSAVPWDNVTVAPCLPSALTGLKSTLACLSSHSRALPSEPMLASNGLAIICHAINVASAPGLEVVSDARPTAITHSTPVLSSAKPRLLKISDVSGVGSDEANTKVP